MYAIIEKVEKGYIAWFDRHYNQSVEEVWAALSNNDFLPKWMPNLKVKELKQGGAITFNMFDGTSFDMVITDYKEMSVLEYEWGSGHVRFELFSEEAGCHLVLKEFIPGISDHTAKDLAGWHVCMDVFTDLLNGKEQAFPVGDWDKWYPHYAKSVEAFQSEK